jgi:hypothetical protein
MIRLAIAVATCFSGSLIHAQSLSSEDNAFFENKVRPLLAKHCLECHGKDPAKIKGGLLLDSHEGWMAGGDSGDVIDPGNPGKSLLMETVRYANQDLQMPPKYKLSDQEIGVLEEWIQRGAPDPRKKSGPIAAKTGIDWSKAKSHWAFQPVKSPPVPPVTTPGWNANPIDRFLQASREKAGLTTAAAADRFTLIRRATIDLTGLPPTIDDINAFVKDPGADDEAFGRVVDRLLASPAFGERWGRHWLDIARYADSVGKTRNIAFPYAWRYRNYVIDSLNADKPYNRFVAEQLAGDLLPGQPKENREDLLVATGFLALGSMDLNERDTEQFLLDRIDDQIDTMSRALLGMTTSCARCHDHKFDPISQKEYYAMAGIFASTDTLSGQLNKGGNGNYFHPDRLLTLSSGKFSPPAPEMVNQSRLTDLPQNVQDKIRVLKRQSSGNGPEAKSAAEELLKLRKQFKKQNDATLPSISSTEPLAMGVQEGKVVDLKLRIRGEPDLKGDTVPRGFPTALLTSDIKKIPSDSSGRLELALWIASPSHPLTARVMTNRVWAHLFGKGLVATVDNFGTTGEAPSHPELLDYLSTEFVKQNWSVKSLIRSIMMSRTYRLSGESIASSEAKDPGNIFLWRSQLRRMEVEVLRDSLLAAGGNLSEERPDGFPAPRSDLNALLNGKGGRTVTSSYTQALRSIYLPIYRSKIPGMFSAFDFAEPDQVNGRRDITTVATQALFLLNDPFVVTTSQKAAERVLALDTPEDDARIRYAYAYTLCRKPTDTEIQRALEFLETTQGTTETKWATFLQALYCSAEFRYIR